jgi:glycosyltransferase involved in cell wall biosynthesis
MKGPILLLTDELLPGGVTRHVIDLANGLAERGIESTVAATGGPFRARLSKQISFVNLSLFVPNSGRKSLFGFISAYRVLRHIISRENVILIHSHKRYTDVLGRVLARRRSLPHISTCHNTFTSLRHVSLFGDFTIACSKVIEEMLIKDFGKDPKAIKQIYNGIFPFREYSKDEKVQVLKDLLIPNTKKIIASVGQLIASKDRATLIRAIGILKKRNAINNIIFAILGEGGQKMMLEELVLEEEIENYVIFLRGMSNVEALFNAAEFMVLSSTREGGLPYVFTEAASIGKPHIATDVGGIPEFIADGETGILIPPSDPGKLADAIQILLEKPSLVKKLGRNAREKYLQQFTYESFIDQTLEVYRHYISF